jgi:hypothetical protein
MFFEALRLIESQEMWQISYSSVIVLGFKGSTSEKDEKLAYGSFYMLDIREN